jgi:hypothetical protein
VSEESAMQLPIQRIILRIQVGEHRQSGSDDPLFLSLRGPSGREFRLLHKHGKTLRRGQEDRFVFGAPDDPETNVAHPELNDPNALPLDAAGITSVFIRKGFEPIPNVRGVGEMDDRLEIIEIEIEFHIAGRPKPIRHLRRGPIWLGLVSGLRFEIPPAEDG